jgi:hypothetical protein
MNAPPLCAQIGWLHGLLVGFLVGALQLEGCCQMVTNSHLMWMALIFAAFAMLVSLFLLCIMRRYTLGSVLLGVFVNAVMVSIIVVFALHNLVPSLFSLIIGVIVGAILGLIVGWLLCLLCARSLKAGWGV